MKITACKVKDFQTKEVKGVEFWQKGRVGECIANDRELCLIGGIRTILACDNAADLDSLRSFLTVHYFDMLAQGFDKDKLHFELQWLNLLITSRANELLEQEEVETSEW